MRFSLIALLPLALAACATTPRAPVAPPLHVESSGERNADTLFVLIHGDSGSDMSATATALIAAAPRSATARILRPGYSDAAGNASPGVRGAGHGDGYTPDRIAAIGDTIAALRQRYRRARIVLVGDGGGAVIAANLAGLRPNLIDGMVLVSCPCALPEWRRHMATREKPAQPWRDKVDSLDPLQTAGGIAPTLRAALVSGADDRAVLPRFGRAYAEALSLRGIATDFRILPGRGANLLNDPQVIEAAARLAAALPRKPR